jgi:hypothetical protein
MFKAAFDSPTELNQIVADSRVPPNWPQVCKDAGYSLTLSPIYVLIYVSTKPAMFRSRYQLPSVVPPNHALFVSRIEPFVGLADHSNHRPPQGGISAASNAMPSLSGTLGGFLKGSDGKFYVLSCNHVLLNPADQVLQPAAGDGGTPFKDLIATTSYVVPIAAPLGFNYGAPYNKIDAAVALLSGSTIPSASIRLLKSAKLGTTVATSSLSIGDNVVFVGKESDYQEAEILHFVARAKIHLDLGGGKSPYNFGDLFEIKPRKKLYVGSLAKSGDSGSIVLRETSGPTYEVCGLLTAASGKGKRLLLCAFFDNAISGLNTASGLTFSLH